MKKEFVIILAGILLSSSAVLAQADLIVKTVSHTGTLTAGNSIRFTAVVSNQGNKATGADSGGTGFEIDNIDGQHDLGVPPTGAIAADGTLTSTSNAWTATLGTHTVVACADWWNYVTELDEKNNCKYYYF